MPNWCANRLKIVAISENIAELKKLMLGQISPDYLEAINKSILFFIAGAVQIARPIPSKLRIEGPEFNFIPLSSNSLVINKPVNETPLNHAFTQWLDLVRSNPDLSETTSLSILCLYEQSGLSNLDLSKLSDEQRQAINEIFNQQGYDWFGSFDYKSEDMESNWKKLENKEFSTLPFDMRLVIPPKLIPEIVGFNGKLFKNSGAASLNSYSSYTDTYGVKWPGGHNLSVTDIDIGSVKSMDNAHLLINSIQRTVHNQCSAHDKGTDISNTPPELCAIQVDFDTPWGPPAQEVFMVLSQKYRCRIRHYFSEAGMSFCGCHEYDKGELIEELNDELKWTGEFEESDDYGSDLIGPDYIIDNVAHYGG